MKIQINLVKQTFKSLRNIHIIFWGSLLIYFVIITINKYDYSYFKFIFGVFNENFLSITILLLNISYFLIFAYKFIILEYNSMPFEIVLRYNAKKWYLSKTITLFISILLLKVMQIIIFSTLGYIFLKYKINFSFFLINSILFSFISIFMMLIINTKAFILIPIWLISLFFINISYLIPIIGLFILYIVMLFSFSFKKLNFFIKI